MEYSKIIAVTGLPGLYELINSKSDGAVVRSLDDKTTKFVSSRVHQFSHLESIEVFTLDENVNLAEVFNAMKESNEQLPDQKDNDKLRKYFEKVYPRIDFEKVYSSDLKKMVKWFDVLTKNKIDIKVPEPEEEAVIEEPVQKAKEIKQKPSEEKKEQVAPDKTRGAKEKPEVTKVTSAGSVPSDIKTPTRKKEEPQTKESSKKTAAADSKPAKGKKETAKKSSSATTAKSATKKKDAAKKPAASSGKTAKKKK